MSAYPNFGKVKTIVFPLLNNGGEGMSLSEYKEKTGIDLKDFIELLDDGSITCPFNGLLLLNIAQIEFDINQRNLGPSLTPVINIDVAGYTQGVQTGRLSMDDGSYFFEISIDKDVDFSLDNAVIKCSEM